MNRLLLSCVALISLISSAGASNTWYVDVNGTAPGTGTISDPYTSIQYAATRPTTLDGDTILVAPGTYVENLSLTNQSMHIRSTAGPVLTRIQPAHAGNTVHLDAGSQYPTLDGFTILPGMGGYAAVFLYDAAITRCILSNPAGNPGGGVFINGLGVITDCTITGNWIGINLDNFGGMLSLRNSIVTGNTYDLSVTGVSQAYYSYSAGITNINLGANGAASLHPGPGNLTGDVGFWDAANIDLHLRPGSQCIDSGDPASPLDPDGSRHDIGALTYDPTYAPAPTVYCAGKLNSQGCVPAIGAIGSASATSGAPFVVTAANEVTNKLGLMLLGLGKFEQPFQGGVLCIQSPTKRLGVQLSGGSSACTGSYAFDMAGYIASGVHPGLVPGALVDCQWWNRDPLDPAGFGSGLSDALSFGIAP